ncbi:hypothetical protein BDN70DRAFT_377932 [Pholiota conissans]|uniref:BTB domain-containing protein n=1 Tax=Pholiota conissans TaxID=109636 RepID=A0A9P5YRP7_9AGAR|nr:hypothetical protein BDN70DRAFT_377932 [Pholiota conissans]
MQSSPDTSLDSPPLLSRESSSEGVTASPTSQPDWKRSHCRPGDLPHATNPYLQSIASNIAGPSSLAHQTSIATFTTATAVSSPSPYGVPLKAPENTSSSSCSSSSETSVTPTRHWRFWIYDGSIVLSVQNTLFCVHQTILATHSEVFADLFTVPQPDGEQTIEGRHVVYLYDDEKDFADLMSAVYIPEHFETLASDADLDTVLTFIEGILRLSTKYVIRHLRQRCIALLLQKLPHTFERYESKATSSSPPDRYRSDTVMRAIRIAKETNVPEALPYAYYCLSRFPHKRFLKDRPGDISWREKMVVLIGRERLQWAQMNISHSFLIAFQRSPTCASPLCAHARSPHAEWHELEKHKAPHPLRAYDSWDQLNVCPDCVAYCQGLHLQGRKEVWKYLPSWFELPPWEELSENQNR